jgi:hypothetical protein
MTGPTVTDSPMAGEREGAPPPPSAPDPPRSAPGPTFVGFTGWRQLALLAASFLIVVGISAALAFRVNPAPDEDGHSFMVRHYAHSVGPVGWQEMQWSGYRSHSYYLYSPAPYAVYLPFQRVQEAVGLVDSAERPDRFVTRLGGAFVFASAQLALTLWMVRRMSRGAPNELVILTALAVNLVPQLRYTHAYINSDSFTILASTACFAVALRLWQRERIGLTDALLVGGALAVTAHGRYNGFVAGVALAGVFGVCVLRKAEGLRVRLRLAGLAVALPLLLAGPVHLSIAQELRNGHVLASTDHDELARSTRFGAVSDLPPLADQVSTWEADFGATWRSTWASYLVYFETLPAPWDLVLAGFCAIGLVGVVLRRPELLSSAGRGVGLLAVGCTLLTWVLMVSWPYRLGRFLLPAGVTALIAIVLGTGVVLQRLTKASGLWLSAYAWIVVLGMLNVLALRSTGPR